MMHYKYQLLVDGHGPGYDSNIWKLLSGGTPFMVSVKADMQCGNTLRNN